jgi:hypothetical protein
MGIRFCILCDREIDIEAPGMKVVSISRGGGSRITVLDSEGMPHITRKIKTKLGVAANAVEEKANGK